MANPILDGIRTGATLVNESTRLGQQAWRDRVSADQFDRTHRLKQDIFDEDKRRVTRQENHQMAQATNAAKYNARSRWDELQARGDATEEEFAGVMQEYMNAHEAGMNNPFYRESFEAAGGKMFGSNRKATALDTPGDKPMGKLKIMRNPETYTRSDGKVINKGDIVVLQGDDEGNMLTSAETAEDVVPGNQGIPFAMTADEFFAIDDATGEIIKSQQGSLYRNDARVQKKLGSLRDVSPEFDTGSSSASGVATGTRGMGSAGAGQQGTPDRVVETNYQGEYQAGNESGYSRVGEIHNTTNEGTKQRLQSEYNQAGGTVERLYESGTEGFFFDDDNGEASWKRAARKGTVDQLQPYDVVIKNSPEVYKNLKRMQEINPNAAAGQLRRRITYLDEQIAEVTDFAKTGRKSLYNTESQIKELTREKERLIELGRPPESNAPKGKTLLKGDKYVTAGDVSTPEGIQKVMSQFKSSGGMAMPKKLKGQAREDALHNAIVFAQLGMPFQTADLMDYINYGSMNALDWSKAIGAHQYRMGMVDANKMRTLASAGVKGNKDTMQYMTKIYNSKNDWIKQTAANVKTQDEDNVDAWTNFYNALSAKKYLDYDKFTMDKAELANMWNVYKRLYQAAGLEGDDVQATLDEAYIANKLIGAQMIPEDAETNEIRALLAREYPRIEGLARQNNMSPSEAMDGIIYGAQQLMDQDPDMTRADAYMAVWGAD